MSITANNQKVREVINQVVNDPTYKTVSSVPLISWQQIGLILLAYGGVFGSIALHLYAEVPIWWLYPVMIFSFYTAFTPLHDATHRAVSSNNFLNDLLGTISATVLFPFATTGIYRYLHLSHHRYVGDANMDPDDAMVVIPTKYFPFGYLLLLFPDVLWVYWLFVKGWSRTPARTRFATLFMFFGLFVFNTVWFLSPYTWEYFILFFIPNRLAIGYVAYSFAHIQHPEGLKWNDFPFQTTYKLIGNKYFLKTFWGQDHHAMHHFLPHVPWYKYHRVWDLANGIFRRQNIPQRGPFSPPDADYKHQVLAQAEKEKVDHLQVKVTAIKRVTDDIKSFRFEPAVPGESLPEFSAGAHIVISLPSGLKRSYSLVNAPFERDHYQISVKLEPNSRGGSQEMHETLSEGDILEISIPRNHFLLYENAKKYLLIAGGIGITPLLSMSHRLLELDKYFELHICARTEVQIPFLYELKNWSFAPNVEYHLDDNGKPTIDLEKVLAGPDQDTLIYICGPAPFNQWVSTTAQKMGWDKNQIRLEYFSSPVTTLSEPRDFQLHLAKRDLTLPVKADQTIIDALHFHNIKVPYSCLQGTCGTCVMEVKEGKIDHRDAVLTEEEKLENKKICLCVSRAAGDRLAIDL